jgi:hypothetical protein
MADVRECGQVRPLLAELAARALTGQERAGVLRHTAGCLTCREELAELAKIADELLLLAPEKQPPVGFESMVVARLTGVPPGEEETVATSARPRRVARRAGRRLTGTRRTRRAVAVLAASAVLVAAAVLGGLAVHAGSAGDRATAERYRQVLQTASGSYLRAEPFRTAYGARAGTLFLYQGSPSWLLVSVTAAPTDGRYEMFVANAAGVAYPIGTCQMSSGTGTAAYRLAMPVRDVTAVRLVGPAGVVLTADP